MKIALVIQNADRRRGGAEQYTLDLARRLGSKGRGHEVTVVAEGGPVVEAEAGFRCLYLGAKGMTRWGRLRDFLRRVDAVYAGAGLAGGGEGEFDVVHAMMPVWRCDVYQPHSGLAMELVATGHLKHGHGWMGAFSRVMNGMNRKRQGLARIEKQMMSAGSGRRGGTGPWLLCFSGEMRDFARGHFGMRGANSLAGPTAQIRAEDHLVMLMNGIDLARFDPAVGVQSRRAIREKWKVGEDQRLGLLVGHNWKLKGVGEAIEALARVNDRRAALMVLGRDEAGPYRKQAQRLGVAEQVLFAGSVSDPRPYYGAADYLVLPTRRDTCSLVVLEALAMGLPVITTRQNGASEAMENGREGVVLERGDIAGLAAAMRLMLDDRRRGEMARAALALRGGLSIEEHVARVEETYRRVVAEPGGGEMGSFSQRTQGQ